LENQNGQEKSGSEVKGAESYIAKRIRIIEKEGAQNYRKRRDKNTISSKEKDSS
jgi:hypothetical protein